MNCPQCGSNNPEEARTCESCGAELVQAQARPSSCAGAWLLGITTLLLVVAGILDVAYTMQGFCLLAWFAALILGLITFNKVLGNLVGPQYKVARALLVTGKCSFIVGLVGLVLFPMFARSVDHVPKSSCQINLKELGTAVIMYHGDYDGMLPSSILYNGSSEWNENDFIGFASSGKSPRAYPAIIKGYLKSSDILYCPSDPNGGKPGSPVSYYWKAAIDAAWYEGFDNERDFAYPSDQIMIYEHNGWHWGEADNGLTDGVSINCVFMDCHVATKRVKNSGYSKSENPPGPLPKSGVGEPAWYNCSDDSEPAAGRFFDPSKHYDKLQ